MPLLILFSILFAPYKTVPVRGCHGEFLDIYQDSRGTIPLPNPMVADHDGKIVFYAKPAKCVILK